MNIIVNKIDPLSNNVSRIYGDNDAIFDIHYASLPCDIDDSIHVVLSTDDNVKCDYMMYGQVYNISEHNINISCGGLLTKVSRTCMKEWKDYSINTKIYIAMSKSKRKRATPNVSTTKRKIK